VIFPFKLRLPVLAAFVLLLAGCASQAYLDGRDMLAAGQVEEGLKKLAQAVAESPDKREYRTYYLRQRELAVAQVIVEADAARAAHRWELAAMLYGRAQAIDPNSERARTGFAELATTKRLLAAAREAEELFGKGDLARAEARARAVLAENPKHAEATAVLRRVEEKRAVDSAPGGVNSPFSRPITLEFRDAPLRGVFETMAKVAGINFVFDKDVRQDLRVTIYVRNTSIEEVMRLILTTNQLERKLLNDSSVLIYPNVPGKVRDYQELMMRTFYLVNTDTKQAQTMIRSMIKTRDLFVDEKLNAIIVRDTPEAIRLIEKLIASIDLPEPEVMLEIEVMEIASSRIQEIGVRWPNQVQYGDLGIAATTTIVNGALTTTNTATSATPPNRIVVNPRPAGLAYSVLNPLAVANLRADVNASNLLANPRIRVRNNEKAKIHIGDKLPVFTTTSTANVGVSASVSYLDVGLKLDIEPKVFLDSEVAMKVGLEVSSVTKEVAGPSGSVAYQVGTRLTNTALRLKDGETQILAGLISDEDRSSGSRVPGLGDIPILGRLFGSQQDSRNKSEIVLLITPRVLRNVVPPQMTGAAYSAGTEAQAGAAPLRLTTAAPRAFALSSGGGNGNGGGAAAADPAPSAVAAPRPAEAEAPVQDAAPAGPQPPVGAMLLALGVNGEVRNGREIGISVSSPGGAVPRAVRVELVFEAAMLEPMGQSSDGPGRSVLNIPAGAPGATGRFRVTGPAGASGSVGIIGVRYVDGGNVDAILPVPLQVEVRR
jgi:general secretion pathway protein D